MRAIVKPWGEIKNQLKAHNIKAKLECGKILNDVGLDYYGEAFEASNSYHYWHEDWLEFINEDEWDAEIYALLLIESGLIWE